MRRQRATPGRSWLVFAVFLRLGLTSFGGPVAHLGYFRAELVARRKWLSESSFADVVALCQFLPGPASSQVGMAIGLIHAGLPGALAAWLGFTAPAALAMVGFGYGIAWFGGPGGAGWLHGLKVVAVAIVAGAVWGMARNLCPDRPRATLALLAASLVLLLPSAAGQLGAIALGALAGGWLGLGAPALDEAAALRLRLSRPLALAALAGFVLVAAGLPVLAAASGSRDLALAASFARASALVFGGGHVLLPLLQQAVVAPGWVSNDLFLAGYGAVQAVPGPLFTFAAYLGTVARWSLAGWIGGCVALVAIFLPSFLLLVGVLPFWTALRERTSVRAALAGVNAAVVGLLLAALYTPVWTSAIGGPRDVALAFGAFLLLSVWRSPPWLVVALGATGGGLLG